MSALGSARGTIGTISREAVARRAALSWHADLARRTGLLARLVDWFRHDTALRRSRRALAELTPEQLRDVGLTREEALAEARRSLYLD